MTLCNGERPDAIQYLISHQYNTISYIMTTAVEWENHRKNLMVVESKTHHVEYTKIILLQLKKQFTLFMIKSKMEMEHK